MHELSRTDARRIAVRAQLLDDCGHRDLLEVVRGLTLLQNDITEAVAPSAELVVWSRIGSPFVRSELSEALADRRLIDLRGMIRPAEDLTLYLAELAAWPGAGEIAGWRRWNGEWVEANDAFRRDILAMIDADGPVSSRDVPDTSTVPWKSSGWNNKRNAAIMLGFLEQRGEVAVAGYRGRDRLYDVASRVYPEVAVTPLAEAVRIRDERRLRSLGVARAKGPECPVEPQDVEAAGESAVVEGVKGTWQVDPAQLDQPFHGRTVLLSPLDRLVFDRKRMAELFGFDYQLEMYKPAAKRRFGYWALPILHGDELIGKVDATAERRAGVLRVDAIHEDEPFPVELTAEVHHEIHDLAEWLGLEAVLPDR